MTTRNAALVAAMILLAAASAFATTYYVDPTAGNDSNAGTSQTAAWKDIPGTLNITGSGWKTIVAGDSIIVKGGTVSTVSVQIDSSHYNNGASGNLIKILSGDLSGWGTGRAVIDGGATTSGSGTYGMGFHIFGPTYIHIEGFEIRNMANVAESAGVYIDGNSVGYDEVVGNLIHEIYGSPGDNGYGIEITGGTVNGYFLVEKNIIYHTEEKAIELYRQGYSTIRYNYVYQTNDHCIVISSPNNTIYRNIIAQSGYHWMTYETPFRPAFGLKFDGGSGITADGNLMYDNLVWDCSSGIGILNANNNQIYFNTVYHSGFQGGEAGGFEGASFAFKDDDGTGDAGDGNTVKDNIFYYNNILNSSGQTVAFPSAMGSNNTVSDNVIYRDATYTNTVYLYTGSSSWYTLAWFQVSCGFSAYGSGNVASGNRAVDPQMAGGVGAALLAACPAGFNSSWQPITNAMSLSSSTPSSVVVGDTMASPMNYDVVMTLRTNFSLGAYESGSSGTGSQPPAAPTGFRIGP